MVERPVMTVQLAPLALLVETDTVNELDALVAAEEVENMRIAPQRIVETTHANEIIVVAGALHGLPKQHDLTLHLTVTAPHHIDTLTAEMHIRQLINPCKRREITLGVDVYKETGARGEAQNQPPQLGRVVVHSNEKCQLHVAKVMKK